MEQPERHRQNLKETDKSEGSQIKLQESERNWRYDTYHEKKI
jgi:hypothetical protein